MNSPAGALAWEIWRKNRYGFWLLFTFLLVCFGFSRVAVHFGGEAARLAGALAADAPELLEATERAVSWREFVFGWSLFLLGGSLLVVFVVSAFSESHPTRGFSGIPARLFTLPVRTRQLVGLPVGFGLGLVAALYLAWSRLVLAPLVPAETSMPDGYLLLLLASALVAFQVLVWTLPGFPRTRATLLTLLITVVVFLSSLPFTNLARWPERRQALMILFGVVLVTAPIAAAIGVNNVRKGDWSGWPALAALMTRITNFFSRRHGFFSPRAALFWIECRRAGRPALGGLAVVVFFILGCSTFLVLGNSHSDGPPLDMFGATISPILMFTVIVWTPILGLMVCADVVSRQLLMSTFQAARPAAIGELVAAKLKAMLAMCLGGWLLVVTSIAVWVVACGLTHDLPDRFTNIWDFRVLSVMTFFSLHVLIGLFPLWLTGRLPALPWSYVVLLAAYGGVANLVLWFDRHPQFQNVALLLIGFVAAVKLGTAVIAFWQALRRRLVTRDFVFTAASVWIVGTALCVQLMSVVAEQANWNEAVVLPFAALLFPIARIALAPLALAMNRNR